ncbi:MAG: sugar transferase [Candidatus Cloacimonetes bacterium]|nr:sugar transferase [Candidatus Cloacimonadota bacterium]
MKRSKLTFLIFDILFITIAFLYMIYLKPASLRIYLPQYIKPFIGFAVVWLIASLLGDKYNISKFNKLINLLYAIIRVDFIVVGIVLVAMYFFGRFEYSRLIVFGTILLSGALEILFAAFYFLRKKNKYGLDDPTTFSLKPRYVFPHFSHDENDFPIPKKLKEVQDSIEHKLGTKYLATQYDVFEFLNSQIPLTSLHNSESLVLNTHTLYNLEIAESQSQEFFLNLHQINDFRRLNQYFKQVNKNLKFGGFFVGCARSIHVRYNYLFHKYPYPLAALLHTTESFVHRILPKLPIFKVFYFAVTKGRNRTLSKAETLGRLQYCGFKVLAVKEIDDKLYFITRKVGVPSDDTDPSFGPFIKLKRIGKDSEILYIYKFRTMHAYSEYLQKYIFDNYGGTIDGDGFQNDFRITSWGKVFRKLWIDELPQLLNWLRGDISLVGVRALSEHKFSLYSEEMQKLRIQFKPGIVPPFYVDLPKNLDELQQSERKYLEKYQKRPIRTQFEYFFKAWWNILVRGVRSK